MSDKRTITVTVNGQRQTREVETRMHLGDFLRRELRLTGTHLGCEHGVCGACTVLLNGEAVRSCIMFAVQADGHQVVTTEGLANPDGSFGAVQQAFWEKHGLQCGFCTPGMLTTLTAFLRETPNPTEEQVRDAISGNLCRCTGYANIVDAAMLAASRLRGEG
jgi:aerobic-type carbon monoxide dehydrogenase small subunit (CoxS/CutS family)